MAWLAKLSNPCTTMVKMLTAFLRRPQVRNFCRILQSIALMCISDGDIA